MKLRKSEQVEVRKVGGVARRKRRARAHTGLLMDTRASQAFRANGLDYPRTVVTTVSPEARIGLLATGRFLTILPKSILRFPIERSEIRALPVELPKTRVSNGIVTLKNRTLSPVAKLFIDCAREVAKSVAKPD